MTRKVIIILASFLGILLALVVYRHVLGPRHAGRQAPPPRGPGMQMPQAPPASPGVEVGHNVRFERRDDYGRLQRTFWCKEFRKIGGGKYHFTLPEITIYQGDGRRMVIEADESTAIVEEVGGSVNPMGGTLDGNVRITIGRGEKDDRARDPVRIHADRLDFDNQLLRITTAGRVLLTSAEADVEGVGLELEWNENPQELRLLKLLEGKRMLIRQGLSALAVARRPAPAPQSRPARKAPVRPAGRARSRPGKARPRPRPVQNIYVAEFHDDVRVASGDRGLEGARMLSLRFELQRNRIQLAPGEEEAPAGKSASRPPRSAKGPRTRPATAAASRAGGGSDPAATAPATSRTGGGRTLVTWRGPLILRPVGHTAQPSNDRYTIEGQGDLVTLREGAAAATCRQFTFASPDQVGELIGSAEKPATLAVDGGRSRVACPSIRVDRRAGMAHLAGAGEMVAGAGSTRLVGLGSTTAPARGGGPPDRITWQQQVQVSFVERPGRAGGETMTAQQVRRAVFRGNVELRQGGTGDSVRCDELDVWLAEGGDGRTFPEYAVARGGVKAHQEGSDIVSDSAAISFREEAARDSAGRTVRRIRPASIRAEGGVTLIDYDEQGRKQIEATAAELTASATYGTAELRGRPAMVKQFEYVAGPGGGQPLANRLLGEHIHVNRNGEALTVRGAGELSFSTDRDFDGRRLEARRPVVVRWQRWMQYSGAERFVHFGGAVHLDSGPDKLTCEHMRLMFTKDEAPATAPATAPAKDKRRRNRFGLGLDRYDRRQIAMFTASRDVVLFRREAEDDKTLRRMELKGDDLVYDTQLRRMDMYGPGTLLLEDYRKPDSADKPAGGDITGPVVSRPSQTAFRWSKSMSLSQQRLLATLVGDVGMAHRSGNQVALKERLNAPDWGKLPTGRNLTVACAEMIARFSESDTAGNKDRQDRFRVGNPELFIARGRVNLVDAPTTQVFCNQLTYNGPREVATIAGHYNGQENGEATFVYQDSVNLTLRRVDSPRVTAYFKGNRVVRVETQKLEGAGSR